ncbi:MAG: cobyrinate a,c-diamide synthase [Rhodospirillaceae bacterium]|nr:cobyrinate a,c-diamide synthase [Rhodospirillaceae bacterium]
MATRGRGLIVAAPASGSGKTIVTLALLRLLARAGSETVAAKCGPDYIDSGFLAAASGRPCLNLDAWAMRPATLSRLVGDVSCGVLVLCEGAMGLFDGAEGGGGSTADIAALTGWPVLLVVDTRGQGASAAAVVRGFVGLQPNTTIAGVVFNRVGGSRHESILRHAMQHIAPGVPVLGFVPRDARLALPERHLGLVQAREHAELGARLDAAADAIAPVLDLAAIAAIARTSPLAKNAGAAPARPLPPLGQRMAVAADTAFSFTYPAILAGWHAAGAEIIPFSPLADEAPDDRADAVYLPGGYPELHAGQLAANSRFLEGLRGAARGRAAIYGECGGYMVLGRTLTAPDGHRHAMAGLLPVETSFAERRLHLGYRQVEVAGPCALGEIGAHFRGHEFHYATVLREGPGDPLFKVADSTGQSLPDAGRVEGSVAGSFIHLIDAA